MEYTSRIKLVLLRQTFDDDVNLAIYRPKRIWSYTTGSSFHIHKAGQASWSMYTMIVLCCPWCRYWESYDANAI